MLGTLVRTGELQQRHFVARAACQREPQFANGLLAPAGSPQNAPAHYVNVGITLVNFSGAANRLVCLGDPFRLFRAGVHPKIRLTERYLGWGVVRSALSDALQLRNCEFEVVAPIVLS